MHLEDFKKYIENRPFVNEIPSDEELNKVLNFSEMLLDTFYIIPEEFKETEEYLKVVYEEAIYLMQNDPTSEFLTKYEGLKQFNIAGAISATVAEEYLPYICRLAKLFLQKYGILPILADNSKISYNYTTF